MLLGFGDGTIDQFVPFQCSVNVLIEIVVAVNVEEKPTAVQSVAVAHDTPVRLGRNTPVGLGLGTIDQVVPFQCSVRVLAVVFDVEDATE